MTEMMKYCFKSHLTQNKIELLKTNYQMQLSIFQFLFGLWENIGSKNDPIRRCLTKCYATEEVKSIFLSLYCLFSLFRVSLPRLRLARLYF